MNHWQGWHCKGRGGKEYLDGFQIGQAIVRSGGSGGEGPELVCRETGVDVGIGQDNCLGGGNAACLPTMTGMALGPTLTKQLI